MYFSAEAGFAASAVLGTGGIWILSRAPSPAERPLATVPLISALQQFIAGIVWVGRANDQATPTSVFSLGLCVAVFISGSPARHPLATHLVGGHVCDHMHLPLPYESLGLFELEFISVGYLFAALPSALILIHLNSPRATIAPAARAS